MKLNILSKHNLIIAVFSGFVFFVALIFSFPANSIQDNSRLLVEDADVLSNQEQKNQDEVSIGMPARIKIPAIQVDADIISVGLTSEGAMDVPKDPAEVGWFNLGDRPGENGTAVVTGHYGWKNNVPAVFDYLHKLKIGDKIIVEDENGKISTFVVRETRKYDKDAIAPEVFGSSDGEGHLNLITCTGSWNRSAKAFNERLVVFADKE